MQEIAERQRNPTFSALYVGLRLAPNPTYDSQKLMDVLPVFFL